MMGERLRPELPAQTSYTLEQIREVAYFTPTAERNSCLEGDAQQMAWSLERDLFSDLRSDYQETLTNLWRQTFRLAGKHDLVLAPEKAIESLFGKTHEQDGQVYYTSELVRTRLHRSLVDSITPGDVDRATGKPGGWTPGYLRGKIIQKLYQDKRVGVGEEGWHLLVLKEDCLDQGFVTEENLTESLGVEKSALRNALRRLMGRHCYLPRVLVISKDDKKGGIKTVLPPLLVAKLRQELVSTPSEENSVDKIIREVRKRLEGRDFATTFKSVPARGCGCRIHDSVGVVPKSFIGPSLLRDLRAGKIIRASRPIADPNASDCDL